MFSWFENDVYAGPLVTATYLGSQRLRRNTLTGLTPTPLGLT